MGRSVSYATGSIAKAYFDVSYMGYEEDEKGNIDTNSFDDFIAQEQWDYWKEDTFERAKELFPSIQPCEKWLGNEDLAIAENSFCYIGVSEYCGLACLWLAPKDFETYYPDQASLRPLAVTWLDNNAHKLLQLSEYNKIGTFSNGESIYQKA